MFLKIKILNLMFLFVKKHRKYFFVLKNTTGMFVLLVVKAFLVKKRRSFSRYSCRGSSS